MLGYARYTTFMCCVAGVSCYYGYGSGGLVGLWQWQSIKAMDKNVSKSVQTLMMHI